MTKDAEEGVQSTGGQVDELVMALLEGAYDKDEAVREAVKNSLNDLGKKQPALVLSSCHSYLAKHSKLHQGHRVIILIIMERVIRDTLDEIENDLIEPIIRQASHEMTQSKDVHPEWQTAASSVLVALGQRYCTNVMAELQVKFQPGVLPHFFVIQTMSHLANANVYGMVPFLKVVLGTMLPMMGMAKQDNMRWVFSSAVGKFSDAILEYVANIEKAPDPSVTKSAFSAEIDAVYDILFNVWFSTKEPKLRLAIVDALGPMSQIMTTSKLDEQLPRLLQGILALYKKHPDSFHVTQSLCMLLEAGSSDGTTRLEPHLEMLLNSLFPQVCQPIDYTRPATLKNHNEFLRCFNVLAKTFSDRVVAYLLLKLENTNEKTRLGTLAIFKHLINSAGAHMEYKKALVLTGLKPILMEPNNKVKRMLTQTIMAMAHHGYLELEGGQHMVEFIVKQCALPPEPPLSDNLIERMQQTKRTNDPEYITNDGLRLMCENMIHMLSTTVECMEAVLWPYLMELIVGEEYYDAIGCVCRAIAHLAGQKRAESNEDYDINYDVNIPKPPVILARLMVMAGRPHNGRDRGVHVLSAMKSLSLNIHDNLGDIWDSIVPKLVQYLDEHDKDDDWCQKSWEDLLLKMLSKSLDVIDDEEWVCSLGEALFSHIPCYANYPEEKNFLFKSMGIVLRKSSKKEFVNTQLSNILMSVKHSNALEREGCAMALGFTAASHVDAVLARIDGSVKNETKRSSSFFNFIKESVNKADLDEKSKSTYMLSYGYTCMFAPPSIITSRIDASIAKNVITHLSVAKDVTLKESLITTVELIGQTVHPDHLKASYSFTQRKELLSLLATYIRAEPTNYINSDLRAQALKACATLVKLDPVLGDDEEETLLKTALDCYLPLPLEGLSPKKGKDEAYSDVVEQEVWLEKSQQALQELVQELLLKNRSPKGMERIYEAIHPWTMSVEDHERERALKLCHHMFDLYLQRLGIAVGDVSHFHNLGLLLARLAPRCTDPNSTVRYLALDCVLNLLKVAVQYEGNASEEKQQMIDAFPMLKDRLKKVDSTALFNVVKDLSRVLIKFLPVDQLLPFLHQLMEGLKDPHDFSSSGACVVLNGLLKARGGELVAEVENLIHALHEMLRGITCSQTRTGTLRSIRTLASHHLISVMNVLLAYNLPYDEHLVSIWQTLGQDSLLMANILDHLLETMARGLPYEEKQDGTKTATLLPLASTVALTEILRVDEASAIVIENYHRILSAIMVRIASTINNLPPKQKPVKKLDDKEDDREFKDSKKDKRKSHQPSPAKEPEIKPSSLSVDGLREFLRCTRSEAIAEGLEEEGVWECFEDQDEFPKAFTTLSMLVVLHQPAFVNKMITCINPVLASVYEPQRVMAAAFFAELINQKCAGDLALVEMLVNGLLGRLVDPSHVVRMLCIRGLGNVASCGTDSSRRRLQLVPTEREQVQKYSTTVLSAMMAGMDDKEDLEDDITLEAMSGLSRILAEIDESHIRAILINISLRIRPCFEKEKASVRAAAFTLFGNLSRFGDGPSKAPFLEQVHTNLVTLLLHLNDPDPSVIKACKYALRHLGPLLESEQINPMFQQHLHDDKSLHYGEFMNDLAKAIIHDFPEKLNFYVMGNVSFFRSSWPEIRSNAAMLTGFLLGNMVPQGYNTISKEHVCGALILLLKDPSSEVRVKASEAMSYLHNF